MKHRAAKLSLFLIVVVIVLSHRSAEANQKPSEKDFGVVRESLITTSHEEIEGSQFSSKSNEVRSDNSNAVNSSSLESERRHSFHKRWSASYEKRAEPRVLFPLSYSTPQRKPNYGLPSKGYRPIKAPPIGYPAARPPTSAYRPPAFKPTKPPQAYGPPKPTGYPPSSNYQQIEQVYITYPPATTTVSYSQGSNYANSGGLYATSTSGAQSGFTGGSYLPPKPSSPAQQSNGNLISFPNPNYEVPIGYPAITSKPNYYTTTKATPTYPSPNQVHSSWSGQTSYPGFPAANTNYPAPSSGSYRPKPTLAPSYTAHATPSTSYGSIHHGPVTSGHLPVFVFIPKPVYSSAQNSYKPAYPKPTVTYPAPSNYYSTVKPSTITHTHYYPAPQYVKPPKPSGVYPPAKAPSTAYGLPKPLAIYSSNRPSGSSYRTDNSQQVSIYSKEHSINQPFDVRLQGGQIYPNSNPLRTHDSSKQAVVASSQPSSFQRGNSVKQSANTNALASSFIDDFKASPIIVGDQIQHSSIQNQTKNGFDGAESNQFFAITDLQGKLEDFPLYRERLRIPFRPESVPNDCGGSWVVLRQPTGSYPDPTQVQIHPIPYSFENSNNGDFNPNLSGQSLRSPDDLSFVTFPPKFNDLPAFDPVLKSIRPGFPDFLVFSTTPNPNSNGIQLHNDATKELWRKPNSIHPLISTISLSDDSKLTDSSIVDQEILSQAVTIKPSVRGSTTALFSTENSIIVSSNAVSSLHNKDKVEFPIEGASPFLVDIITPFNDELNNKTGKSIVNSLSPTEDILTETHFNRNSAELIEDSDRLISLLRAANLRALSSLIAQADIAGLLFDKEYTIIAPSNAAFKQVPANQRQRWVHQPDTLREMLLHHIIPMHMNSSSFENEAIPATLAGSRRLRINVYNATDTRETAITVNGARILTFDLRIGNLLVHVVDRVLLPTTSSSQTVLDILSDGGLQASLLGPALTTVLSSDSTPLTVFVPTTEAFLNLNQEQRNEFLNNETAFHNLFWYHIIPGTYYSEGLENGEWLTTLHGVGRIHVEVARLNRKNKLGRVNGEANVVESDVSATNGVVHFIDRILINILQ